MHRINAESKKYIENTNVWTRSVTFVDIQGYALNWTNFEWSLVRRSLPRQPTLEPVTTGHTAWHYPVPHATSSTFRTACSFSKDTTQLLYSCVLLCVSPMYSSQTFAALPSAYWSGRPSAATPRERVLNTLSTDMLLLVPARVFSLSSHTCSHSERRRYSAPVALNVYESELLVWQVFSPHASTDIGCCHLYEQRRGDKL